MSILSNQTPPGTIIAGAGANPPNGYLLCDGSTVSRAFYANLFRAINVAWGFGNNATTFNIPDLRGMFLRGTDSGRGLDPDSASRFQYYNGGNTGDAVGSNQNHAMPDHQHYARFYANAGTGMPGNSSAYVGVNPGLGGNATNWYGQSPPPLSSESRPVNSYVNYYIKY